MHTTLALILALVALPLNPAQNEGGEAWESTPPRELSQRGAQNLAALAELLALVRFFHPDDAAAKADWEAFASAGVLALEEARDAADLAARLVDLFAPIAPAVQVFDADGRPTDGAGGLEAPSESSGELSVTWWRHHGPGWVSPQGAIGPFASERVRRPARGDALPPDTPDPHDVHEVQLAGGAIARVPFALWADADGTFPRGERAPLAAPTVQRARGEDRTTRLAAVVLAWGALRHFYPYFHAVEVDWPGELLATLGRAATDADDQEFLVTLELLVAALQDGHGLVFYMRTAPRGTLPLLWDLVEDELVVTVPDPEGKLERGDVVARIDGQPVAGHLAELSSRISSATPGWMRARLRQAARVGPRGQEVELEVFGADERRRKVLLTYLKQAPTLEEARPPAISELEEALLYVDLERVESQAWAAALARVAQARGVIFDLRGYPKGLAPNALLPHLSAESLASAYWRIPVLEGLSLGSPEYVESRWNLPPALPRISGKVVFLMDGRAISYAESLLGIVEAYALGELVGEPTAGTNGNIATMSLPGGYRLTFSAMRVDQHDRSAHHGVGILPTVPASRTIAGVRAGRDELLEAALEQLR